MTPQPGSIFHRVLYPRHTSELVVQRKRRRRILVQEEYAIGRWYLRQTTHGVK